MRRSPVGEARRQLTARLSLLAALQAIDKTLPIFRIQPLDDIVDTAGTLVKTVDALLENGATAVHACASHAVLSGPAVDRIAASRMEQLVLTNTIPLREAAQKVPKIKVLSIAGLLGRAIESIHMETSVSTLFN